MLESSGAMTVRAMLILAPAGAVVILLALAMGWISENDMTDLTPRSMIEDAVRDAEIRVKHIKDDRVDSVVKALCEQFGYGAVMDSAMRQWLQKDERGAIITVGCMSVCRAVLEADA